MSFWFHSTVVLTVLSCQGEQSLRQALRAVSRHTILPILANRPRTTVISMALLLITSVVPLTTDFTLQLPTTPDPKQCSTAAKQMHANSKVFRVGPPPALLIFISEEYCYLLPRIFEGLMNHTEVIHKRQGLCRRVR
jgi:hypothetical protein